MASARTGHGIRARLLGISLSLIVLSACSQEPAEQEPGPAQERPVARADCRGEVAAAFARLETSGRPNRKETIVTSDRWTFHEIVEFVPPDQTRLSSNTGWIMAAYYVQIGQQAWANWSPFPWGWREEPPDARFGQMKRRTSDDFAAAPNVHPPVYECLGGIEFEGTAYLGYRARAEKWIDVVTFNGTLSEARKRELDHELEQLRQMPQEWRTVFVDPKSMLPAYELVAQQNQLGNPSSKVRYTYPNTINIRPPLWCRVGLCRSVRR